MGKVVLTQKDDSGYADQDGVAYHFPRRYLDRILSAVGDYAIFYQPRRGVRGQCYWAIARIDEVRPDPAEPDHFYAFLSDHAEFPQPVKPWKTRTATWESSIQLDERTLSRGRMGWSVRPIPDEEFYAIIAAGMAPALQTEGHASGIPGALSDIGQTPLKDDRLIREAMGSRLVRDAAFSRIISNAYEQTCAFTGIRVLDHNGHAEMEAAHIRPITDKGPDIASNGLALCQTAHWLFDHGLVSIANDLHIIRSSRLPSDLDRRLKLADTQVRVPRESHLRPHAAFLEYHRDVVFKP
ncbi:HNH endonuclease [Maricaulis sp.]|jgi:putative restriction endonuclease|uniref:HNH endonuclease n=1 Tax=Maricaulis sp. TaxID=1486257 RepID=UPI0025D40AA8|nr:HNH endonuclease [Maricaulis sp.]MDF1767589.1 HNH endonuclease [Maricaulis sp.]